MKQREELKQLRSLDGAGLEQELKSAKEELLKLNLRHASGQLEQTARLRSLKKRIARIRTMQSAQQSAQ